MKKFILIFFALILFLPLAAKAEHLAARLSGRILLQVQAHGEAWYVYPVNLQRFYLGRPIDAFNVMRNLSLGINNRDFDSFQGRAPRRLAGRILLKVEDLGRAFYVNPTDLSMHFLGRPDDAFSIMRSLGLGITTANLSHIPISGASATPPGEVVNIVVFEPAQNDLISSPLRVEGNARVFENTVNIRLRDANGRILTEEFTTAASPDVGQFGFFSEQISFSRPNTATGNLEVFTISAKDGSEIEKVVIAVRF